MAERTVHPSTRHRAIPMRGFNFQFSDFSPATALFIGEYYFLENYLGQYWSKLYFLHEGWYPLANSVLVLCWFPIGSITPTYWASGVRELPKS